MRKIITVMLVIFSFLLMSNEKNVGTTEKKANTEYGFYSGKSLGGNFKDSFFIVIPEKKEIDLVPQNISINILYEDNDIAVIDKKAGLVIHPSYGHESGTLVNAIMFHINDLSGINGEIRPGIVHRLDKDTSGLIIIAKNDKAHNKLSEMFKNKEINKTYLAIVKGSLGKDTGRLETQMGRDLKDRKKMSVLKTGGKTAITNYEVLDKNDKFSLVRVNIETGRTHQIRVHMKYLGYPILGDSVYGKESKSVKRQMLHAYKLEFIHPVTGKEMIIKSEIPKDFSEVLERIKLHADENLL